MAGIFSLSERSYFRSMKSPYPTLTAQPSNTWILPPNQGYAIQQGPQGLLYIYIPYQPILIESLKALGNARWHPKSRYWSLPQIKLDQVKPLLLSYIPSAPPSSCHDISNNPETALVHLAQEIKRRGYSRRTLDAYLGICQRFLSHTQKPLTILTPEDGANFINYLNDKNHYTAATLHHFIYGLIFFYKHILHAELRPFLVCPKKKRKLPVVLSRHETESLFSALQNPKHQLLLMTIYSAGLRVSEAVTLRPEDIDLDRNLIRIRNAKGGKDRYSLMSESLHTLFERSRNYHISSPWLFPGRHPAIHVTIRTAQKIFEDRKSVV